MSGATPAANAPADQILVPATSATSQASVGPGTRTLTYTPAPPTTTEIKNLVNAIKGLGRIMDATVIVKEFEWKPIGGTSRR